MNGIFLDTGYLIALVNKKDDLKQSRLFFTENC